MGLRVGSWSCPPQLLTLGDVMLAVGQGVCRRIRKEGRAKVAEAFEMQKPGRRQRAKTTFRNSSCIGCVLLLAAGSHATSWDCESSPQLKSPIQYMRCGTSSSRPSCHDPSAASGHGFYSLNVATGRYASLFTISDSELSFLDACGLSPADGYAYCAALVGASAHSDSRVRLIRFGSAHADPTDAYFEYVGVMPVPWICNPMYNDLYGYGGVDADAHECLGSAGAFGPSGEFRYVLSEACDDPDYCSADADSMGDLYMLRPDGEPGFPPGQYDHVSLPNFQSSSMSSSGMAWPYPANSLAVTEMGGFFYSFVMEQSTSSEPNPNIYVYVQSETGSTIRERSYRSVVREGSRALPANNSAWGSMWAFGNKVLAAHSGGAGVYLIDTEGLDITDASVTTLTIEYVGPAEGANDETDGLSCANASYPFAPLLATTSSTPPPGGVQHLGRRHLGGSSGSWRAGDPCPAGCVPACFRVLWMSLATVF